MQRWCLLGLGLFITPTALAAVPPVASGPAQWIWADEGDPATQAPAGTRHFRFTFALPRPADEADLDLTADDRFTVWVNGVEIGSGSDWRRVRHFEIAKHLRVGVNVIAVAATNTKGPAGLLARLSYVPNGQSRVGRASDGSWRVSPTAAEGWVKPEFDDAAWPRARVLGPASGTGRWTGLVWDAGGDDRFRVPPGFVVESVVAKPDANDPFSLINLTFDRRGRLLVAQERGPVWLCTEPDGQGVFQSVEPFATQVSGCQGMCWLDDALYVVGQGPEGAGLYRLRDTNNDDRADEVTTLHRFQGDMAEHGPHAVVPGPDGFLYLVVGNHAWAKPAPLAANSPLTRWPNGQMGPDQGQPGTTEDVLLPRVNDARGHAADLRAPGGTIWRCDRDGQNLALVAAGFRNHYDAAFTPDGELFTFDSDMEWDEGLPWYRAVRVCHCPPGADFLWRTGAANTPNDYPDSLPPAAETGRGSPVGMTSYDHSAFPSNYHGALFLGDWSIGTIWVGRPVRKGSSFTLTPERFCTGSAMNVTDLAVGPDGALYATLGGRGTQGGVLRVRYTGSTKSQPLQPIHERAHAVWQLGLRQPQEAREPLLAALADDDALVRRRACESIIRAGIEPTVAPLKPLLMDQDIFLRTAARLVLQRLPAASGAGRLLDDANDRIALEAVIALAKTGQLVPYTDRALKRLHAALPRSTDPTLTLDLVRGVQLVLIHGNQQPTMAATLGDWIWRAFPTGNTRLDRELAIGLTHLRRAGTIRHPVHARLLDQLTRGRDQAEQIHLFYCLRLLHDGWTPEQKARLLSWFDSTKTWSGGHSFAPYLEAILRDWNPVLTPTDRQAVIARAAQQPWAATAMLRLATPEQLPPPDALLTVYRQLMTTSGAEMREGLVESLAKQGVTALPALRTIGELDAGQRVAVGRALARHPVTADNLPHLVGGLEAVPPPLYAQEMIDALMKSALKPKADDARAVRGALLTAQRMPPERRWKVVELLRHWSGRRFGADDGDWKSELRDWTRWYRQTFPNAPPPPDLAASDRPTVAKYSQEDLLKLLTGSAAAKGDAARGRLAFTKASCVKCHKYGTEGQSIGPDLTTLSQRFQRKDMIEAIVDPSKVISDQYRSQLLVTTTGQTVAGIVAEQGDTLTVTLQDAAQVTLKKAEIEERFASLVSVMPEGLLDALTKEEIVDLFTYLESAPVAGR